MMKTNTLPKLPVRTELLDFPYHELCIDGGEVVQLRRLCDVTRAIPTDLRHRLTAWMSGALKRVGYGVWIETSKIYGCSIRVRRLAFGGEPQAVADFVVVDAHNRNLIPVKDKASVRRDGKAVYGFTHSRFISHIIKGEDPQFIPVGFWDDEEIEV